MINTSVKLSFWAVLNLSLKSGAKIVNRVRLRKKRQNMYLVAR